MRSRTVWALGLHFFAEMFVKQFFFSAFLMVFTGMLLLLGVIILADAVRRFATDLLKSARKEDRGVVLVVDIARPVANRVGHQTNDFVQRPVVVTEKKVS